MQNLIYIGLEQKRSELKISLKAIFKRHILPNDYDNVKYTDFSSLWPQNTNIFSYGQLNNFQVVMICSH